jgi:hypothetical protein
MFAAANKFVISIVLLSFVSGCTTTRSLPTNDAQSVASQLKIGDKVRITRSDASEVKFKIDAISNEGIEGDGIFVAYADMQQVQIKEHSTGKTVALVAVILTVLIGWAAYADAVGTLLGGL